MRHEYQAKMPEVADKIKFYIGDVRNLQSCKDAMHGVDYIFMRLHSSRYHLVSFSQWKP